MKKRGLHGRLLTSQSFALALAGMLGAAFPAIAEINCKGERGRLAAASTLNVRIDNDFFGGAGQDQGYSNGFLISSVSPNLVSYQNDPCLPGSIEVLNRYLMWLQPGGYDEQNMVMGLSQVLFTPTDRTKAALIEEDRPYAAALLLSVGYNARSGDHLRTSQIRIGVVGPSALGEQVQNGAHKLLGQEPFDGWSNQLRDEPVLQLIHEHRWRWARAASASGWGWDATGHLGGSLGNFATYGNSGLEWRFGYQLPDDFGTAPLRPAGENASPISEAVGRFDGLAGHMFLAVDGRWVLHDITLDGNTFRSSHSVDKRPLVADLAIGFAVTKGAWRFALARYYRTSEFDGQRDIPVYGTFTVGRRFQ